MTPWGQEWGRGLTGKGQKKLFGDGTVPHLDCGYTSHQ